MSPLLIGYWAKRVVRRPDWLDAISVVEICSVSDCISKPPEGWVQAWEGGQLGSWGLLASPEDAQRLVPEEAVAEYDLFAYEVEPARYVDGMREEIDVEAPGVVPLTTRFQSIGYDVVSGERDERFDCSPLSCNSWAEEVGANAYCLVDELETAHRLAAIAESSGCEPGDYFVVRVWRRVRDASQAMAADA